MQRDPRCHLDGKDSDQGDNDNRRGQQPHRATHTDEGIVAAVEARRRQAHIAILVLSAYVEQAFATELLAGGSQRRLGYLLKERVGRVEEFLLTLHRVAAGGTAIDPEIVAQLFARSRPPAGLDQLSPREREVLALMAEGLVNAAIATRLGAWVRKGQLAESGPRVRRRRARVVRRRGRCDAGPLLWAPLRALLGVLGCPPRGFRWPVAGFPGR